MTYATPVAPVVTPPAKIKPGKVWIWIGALLIVAGVVGAIALFVAGFVGMSRTVDDFARFAAPVEGQTLTFEKSGTFTLYYEYESEIDGQSFSSPEEIPPDLSIEVTTEDGTPMIVSSAGTSVSFSISGKAGEAVNKVTIPQPGTYIVDVSADSTGGEQFVIAVGKGVLGRLFAYIGAALVVGFLGFAVGLVLIIVTAVKRSRRRKERRAAEQAAAQQASWAAQPAPVPTAATAAPPWPPAGQAPPLPPPPPSPDDGGWAPPPPPPS